MLGRKQSIKNEDWLEAVAHIGEKVTKSEIDALTKKTVSEIKKTCKGKRAAYAWSAGKDSIVLGKLCEAAGYKQSLIGVCNLEYPAFMAWIEENKPQECEIINVGLDLDWLAKHENMLFPQDSSIAGHWFSIVQHKAQRQYFLRNKLDIIMLGRRRADGNYTGKGGNIYTDTKGVTRFSRLDS